MTRVQVRKVHEARGATVAKLVVGDKMAKAMNAAASARFIVGD
ncbi:MAG TPA: hypothetical protein VIH43_04860 [Chthoniobacterales bacterium]|jgi:hypothetical protein